MPIIQRIALRGSLIFWRSFNMVPSFGSQILVQGMTFLGMYRTIQSVLSLGTFPVFPVKPEFSNFVNLLSPGPPGPENSLSLPHSNSLTPSPPLPLSFWEHAPYFCAFANQDSHEQAPGSFARAAYFLPAAAGVLPPSFFFVRYPSRTSRIFKNTLPSEQTKTIVSTSFRFEMMSSIRPESCVPLSV